MCDRMMYCISNTIGVEGVWSKGKNDRGGETVYGISRKSFPGAGVWVLVDAVAAKYPRGSAAFIKVIAASSDIRAAAVTFYKKEVWMPSHASLLSQPTDFFYYDLYVNSGPSGAAAVVSNVASALGNKDAHALAFLQTYKDANQMGLVFLRERKRRYQLIVKHDPSQGTNFLGWMNRLRHIGTMVYGNTPTFLDQHFDNVL